MINLTTLHLEPTNRCNARCPQCARTDRFTGETVTWLEGKEQEWDPEHLDDVLSHHRFANLQNILINGNFGDIVMHTRPLELLRVCRKHARDNLRINTNGSGLKKEFWQSVAELNPIIDFSIEGLTQDIHHQYRRNTILSRIFENATAFIEAGGRAQWVMTVFQHNEHQVEACAERAKEMGFIDFWARNGSERFQEGQPLDFVSRGEVHTIAPATNLSQYKRFLDD